MRQCLAYSRLTLNINIVTRLAWTFLKRRRVWKHTSSYWRCSQNPSSSNSGSRGCSNAVRWSSSPWISSLFYRWIVSRQARRGEWPWFFNSFESQLFTSKTHDSHQPTIYAEIIKYFNLKQNISLKWIIMPNTPIGEIHYGINFLRFYR